MVFCSPSERIRTLTTLPFDHNNRKQNSVIQIIIIIIVHVFIYFALHILFIFHLFTVCSRSYAHNLFSKFGTTNPVSDSMYSSGFTALLYGDKNFHNHTDSLSCLNVMKTQIFFNYGFVVVRKYENTYNFSVFKANVYLFIYLFNKFQVKFDPNST